MEIAKDKQVLWLSLSLASTAIVFSLMVAYVNQRFSTLENFLGMLRGAALVGAPENGAATIVSPDQMSQKSITLRNLSYAPVTIVGCRLGCVARPTNLPNVVPPGQSLAIQFEVKGPQKLGNLAMPVVFYTDQQRQPVVELPFRLQVVAEPHKSMPRGHPKD